MSNYPDGVSDNDIDRVMSGSDNGGSSFDLECALSNLKTALICLESAERETNNTTALEAISDSINWVEGYAIPYCEIAISELED